MRFHHSLTGSRIKQARGGNVREMELEKRQAMQQNARRFVAEERGVQALEDGMVQLYEQVMNWAAEETGS